MLALHPGDVGGLVVTVVPLLLVVDERLDGGVVLVVRHDAHLVARTVHENHLEGAHVVVDAPATPPHARLHRVVLEGRLGPWGDALEHFVVVLRRILEAHGRAPSRSRTALTQVV